MFRLIEGKSYAIQPERRVPVIQHVAEFKLEMMLVGVPQRMVAADQFSPTFRHFAVYKIRETVNSSTNSIARLIHRDVIPQAIQFIRRAKSCQPRTDHRHFAARPVFLRFCGVAGNMACGRFFLSGEQ